VEGRGDLIKNIMLGGYQRCTAFLDNDTPLAMKEAWKAVSKERLGENSSIGLSHVSGLCAIMDYFEQCLGFVKQFYRRMCIRTFLGQSKMLLIGSFEFPSRRRFSSLRDPQQYQDQVLFTSWLWSPGIVCLADE
jgi:hypothetical protein